MFTPGDVLRRHAQYNETSYNAFLLADAARKGTQRGLMTVDARALQLTLDEGAGIGRQPALSFKGLARFGVPKDSGGYAGSLVVNGPAQGLEILAADRRPSSGPAAAIQAWI